MCKKQDDCFGHLCPVGLVADRRSFQVTNPGILAPHKIYNTPQIFTKYPSRFSHELENLGFSLNLNYWFHIIQVNNLESTLAVQCCHIYMCNWEHTFIHTKSFSSSKELELWWSVLEELCLEALVSWAEVKWPHYKLWLWFLIPLHVFPFLKSIKDVLNTYFTHNMNRIK